MEIYIEDLEKEVPFELNSNYKYIEKLAKGSFGTVVHVLDKNKNQDLAIKIINKSGSSPDSIRKMKEEITILKQLKHENIVQFYGYEETNSKLYIIMQYLKYGTLNEYINQNKGKITEENASIIIHKILSATDYLHNKQIFHRDIKPENIMFSKENDLNSLKLIDFGLSAQNLFNPLINGYCGTLLYMSPEQIENKFYSQTVDIWSIGIILYMLLNNGKHPFYIEGENENEYCEKIKKCNLNYHNHLSYMAKNLIHKLLEPNPSWRYTSDKALRHPWITRNKNDEIPKTFNEILTFRNNVKNSKCLLLMSIFFNFCKKNNYLLSNEKSNSAIEIIKKKHNKNKLKINKEKIFHIDSSYINKCNYFSNQKKENLKKEKIYGFEVIDLHYENLRRKSVDLRFLKNNNSFINEKLYSTKYKNFIKIEDSIRKVNTNINNISRKVIKNPFKIKNSEQKKKNNFYLKIDNEKLKQKNIKYILKEEGKSFSPNSKITIRKFSKNLNNKNDIFPKLYSHKKVITDSIEEKIKIVPLILPNIPFTNRFINCFK